MLRLNSPFSYRLVRMLIERTRRIVMPVPCWMKARPTACQWAKRYLGCVRQAQIESCSVSDACWLLAVKSRN